VIEKALAHDATAEPGATNVPLLQPMRRENFEAFFALAVAAYAGDNVAVGRWRKEEALELARAETSSLLPEGADTEGHFLFELVPRDLETTVGYLWFATLRRGTKMVAHVYYLHVLEDYRRRGYGRAALLEAEGLARESGHVSLVLNVFAGNTAARALYTSLRYETTSLSLAKEPL
jgi:ribosomal protein S18 acetylase RimI-like enzyme